MKNTKFITLLHNEGYREALLFRIYPYWRVIRILTWMIFLIVVFSSFYQFKSFLLSVIVAGLLLFLRFLFTTFIENNILTKDMTKSVNLILDLIGKDFDTNEPYRQIAELESINVNSLDNAIENIDNIIKAYRSRLVNIRDKTFQQLIDDYPEFRAKKIKSLKQWIAHNEEVNKDFEQRREKFRIFLPPMMA